MKQAITILAGLILTAQGALASPSVIGTITGSDDFTMNAQQTLKCYHVDEDRDGIRDTSLVTLDSPYLGFLAKGQISGRIPDIDGSVCNDVKTIVENSHMNFTGISTSVTSQLLLDRSGNIIENYTIEISNISKHPDSPVVTISGSISKPLNQ